MSVIEATSSEQFKELLSKNAKVAVFFTAKWASPCKKIGPVFTTLSNKYGSVVCVSVDVDTLSGVAEEQGVSAVPAFKFFHDDTEALTALESDKESQLQEKLEALNGL
ncbi:thioredoxin family protein [Kitasatospora sp. NPDC059327]|uniref:thioredoxin family protein n=1 Tax=Kitasatospora sp. NPDC059327 TaxID=3346803 RepID=UPI0036A56449